MVELELQELFDGVFTLELIPGVTTMDLGDFVEFKTATGIDDKDLSVPCVAIYIGKSFDTDLVSLIDLNSFLFSDVFDALMNLGDEDITEDPRERM
mmetsp:Transcript_65625/g.73220  ORF Transcript_65625/g.73220 Transcript_65625/m.73220 type:complete len:96 (+) Transcript_65625:790-1077(+)